MDKWILTNEQSINLSNVARIVADTEDTNLIYFYSSSDISLKTTYRISSELFSSSTELLNRIDSFLSNITVITLDLRKEVKLEEIKNG